jgi:hypothetical protein
MPSSCKIGRYAAAVCLLFFFISSALAQESATATISSTPDGPDFDYTISLTNTGSTAIGTFWFAWTPPNQPFEYDFLPSSPLATSEPIGWVGPGSLGSPGYSIEYYNVSGSAISHGQTATFGFTSSDSPTTLQGTSLGFPITTSFIYTGAPEVGTAVEVSPVFVPEPSWLALALPLALIAVAARRRAAGQV